MKKEYNAAQGTCRVTFTLPKTVVGQASEVLLLGDFNNWNPNSGVALLPAEDGNYKTTVELEAGQAYQFKYLLDRQRWENDWYADDYVPNVGGSDNSVVLLKATTSDAPLPNRSADETTTGDVAAIPAAAKPSAAKTPSSPDDLTRLEGIGKKLAQVLNDLDILSFADLATADTVALKAQLIAVSTRYKKYDPTNWQAQAQLAAKGDTKALKQLQQQLKTARKKKK